MNFHATPSLDSEEVASLLLGSFDPIDSSLYIANVKSCIFLARKDKKKDRVEISSEQLSSAIEQAEKMGMTVIGWCHSHPKITVWPSNVDLRTQQSFQGLDNRFFGLIYSTFHRNQNSVGHDV